MPSTLFSQIGVDNLPFLPEYRDLPTDQQDLISWEHRLASRQVAFSKSIIRIEPWPDTLFVHLYVLTQSVLLACADGPMDLAILLTYICDAWQPDKRAGPCLHAFSVEERCQLNERIHRHEKFQARLAILTKQLGCTEEGAVDPEDYEEAMKDLAHEKAEWDDQRYGGPFPFEDGRWGVFLR